MTVLDETAALTVRSHTWRVVPGRCAVAVWMPRTPWRARLRLLGAQLTVPEDDGAVATLSAVLSTRALFASLPTAGRWFLPDVARTHRLVVQARGPVQGSDDATSIDARVVAWAGAREWSIPALVLLRQLGDGLGTLEFGATFACREYSSLFGTPLRVHGAAEVTRCA